MATHPTTTTVATRTVTDEAITGPALRGLRASAFVSIRDLARTLAISEQRLGRIERSQRLEIPTVRRYLAALAALVGAG